MLQRFLILISVCINNIEDYVGGLVGQVLMPDGQLEQDIHIAPVHDAREGRNLRMLAGNPSCCNTNNFLAIKMIINGGAFSKHNGTERT